MSAHGPLIDVLILLAAAVLFVPVSQRLGLGSVLGYLIAGLVVGPWGLKLITDAENLSHVSEMGVVFLLFIIGLELEPKRLWNLRFHLLGSGLSQMLLVTAAVLLIGRSLGFSWEASFVGGVGIALSSTAIAMQILRDKNLSATKTGQSAFAILLFQDVAVIPVLALLPMLAAQGAADAPKVSMIKIVGAIVVIIVAGHYLLRPVFRLVASTHLREAFTALCLLFVVGLAAAMNELGASMALGAFLGGVLLATSEYRHAVETDIEPFKGLLLGLFFISVGIGIDVGTIAENPKTVLSLVCGILVCKIAIHSLIAKFSGLGGKEIPFFSLVLSQVGEFAFVLYALAETLGLLTSDQKILLSAAVALSMATTPLLVVLFDRLLAPRLSAKKSDMEEKVENDHPEVIIAGFGRVGQIVGRLLYANRIRATVLDHDPDQIELLRQFGFKVYYGDATRLDLLTAAGAETAKILVVAIDDVEDSLQLVDMARENFPHLKMVVRARNVGHGNDLLDRGVTIWERETFEGSLRLGVDVLELMGFRPHQAVRAAHIFREHNIMMIEKLRQQRANRAQMLSVAKQAREDLEQMFVQEEENLIRQKSGWDAGDFVGGNEFGK